MSKQREVRSLYREGVKISQISKELGISRPTVRKIVNAKELTDRYIRNIQPYPKLGEYTEKLEKLLRENRQQKRKRTTLSLYEELSNHGYKGSYSAVSRYAKKWQKQCLEYRLDACIPLHFKPGEAYQFDWSDEVLFVGGGSLEVKAAHFSLCYSRSKYMRIYPNEKQEMLFDAHVKAFEFFGGSPTKGIYDNMKTAIDKILKGKDRKWNKEFENLCAHYFVEPVACSPAGPNEKGRVERQVEINRQKFLTNLPDVTSIEELNEILISRLNDYNKTQKHPEYKDRTIDEVYQEEKQVLVKCPVLLNSYKEKNVRVSKTALAMYDRNSYSVDSKYVGEVVQARAYSDLLVFVYEGKEIGRHKRIFSKGGTSYDVNHYLPLLLRKPGAWRNGAPFMNMELAEEIRQVESHLRSQKNGERDFALILSYIPSEGMDSVIESCKEAIRAGTISKDAILNILLRQKDSAEEETKEELIYVALEYEVTSDCSRYDKLLKLQEAVR